MVARHPSWLMKCLFSVFSGIRMEVRELKTYEITIL